MRIEFPIEVTAEAIVIKAATTESENQEEQDNTDG